MKVTGVFILACLVSATWAAPTLTCGKTLEDDFKDIEALIPQQKVQDIVMKYLAVDDEVAKVFDFLQSPDNLKLTQYIDNLPEFQKFVIYLHNNGVHVYKALEELHKILGFPDYVPPSSLGELRASTGGLVQMLKDIAAVIPASQLQAIVKYKAANCARFQDLIVQLKSDNVKTLDAKIRAYPIYKQIVQSLKQMNIDVDKVHEILKKIFGWGTVEMFLKSTLNDDFKDFEKLIPMNKIANVVMDYIANDDEVAGVMDFIQSKQFANLVLTVEKLPEYLNFINYVQKQGVNIYAAINKLHDFLGLPPLVPPTAQLYLGRVPGVRGMLDAIEALIPQDKINALYQQKMKTSPDFAAFINKMRSNEFKQIVMKLKANPTFQYIEADAKKHGVDIAKIIDVLNKIFGWNLPPMMM